MQWEYYRLAAVESNLDDALLDLGKEGWELVSVLPETRLFHGFQCLFKRLHSCSLLALQQRIHHHREYCTVSQGVGQYLRLRGFACQAL